VTAFSPALDTWQDSIAAHFERDYDEDAIKETAAAISFAHDPALGGAVIEIEDVSLYRLELDGFVILCSGHKIVPTLRIDAP
jgi:hypothetical protein